MKKIVILNGSPLKNGHTTKICNHIFKDMDAQIITYFAYFSEMRACTACEYCFKHENECVIKDEFQNMMADIADSDVVVLASPIHFSSFSGKLLTMVSRMQYVFALKYIHGKPSPFKPKKGITIVSGGNDYPTIFDAIKPVDTLIFDHVNAEEIKRLFIRSTDAYTMEEIFEQHHDEIEEIIAFLE